VLITRLRDIFIPQARQEGNLRNQKKKERKEKMKWQTRELTLSSEISI
jgi:hypothetical protein